MITQQRHRGPETIHGVSRPSEVLSPHWLNQEPDREHQLCREEGQENHEPTSGIAVTL